MVLAVDIIESRVNYTQNNAKIYNVDHKIEFIVGDFLKINIKNADLVFLNPHWENAKENGKRFCIYTDITPNINEVLDRSYKIAKNIVLALPKYCILDEIIEIFSSFISRNNM